MRRVVLICGLVACTASAEVLAQDLSAAEVKDVRSEIERLHGHEQEAFASGDCEAVASFYADDVTFFANGRAVPSVEALVSLCGRIPRPFEQHTAMRNELRVLSEDAAQSVQVIEFALQREADDLRREVVTKVWSKGPEGWKIVHFHSSISAIAKQ